MIEIKSEANQEDYISRNMFTFFKGVDKDNATLTFRVCRKVGNSLVVVKLWYENTGSEFIISDLGTIKIWFGSDISVIQQYWNTKLFSPSNAEAQVLMDGYIRTVKNSLPIMSALSEEVLK